LVRARPPAPPALTIAGLIDDDPENPGAKRRLSAKPVQCTEHPEKHFLREVQRFLTITQKVGGQAEDQPMMLEDELRVCGFVPGETALDERRLGAGNLRPSDGFGGLDRHSVSPDYSSLAFRLDPGAWRKFPLLVPC